MNCNEFAEHISEFIDGELKIGIRKNFIHHREKCSSCNKKLMNLSGILNEMPNIPGLQTSNDFMQKLHLRIKSFENPSNSIMKLYRLDYISSIGIAASIFLLIGASYLLMNLDSIPIVDLDKINISEMDNNESNILFQETDYSVDDKDSLDRNNNKQNFNSPIRLVGGSK